MASGARSLHRFALFVASATFFVLIAGASVTSTGSGLAVPDWPLSFGTLFPPMKGGVFFEHGHRMVAGSVLLLAVVLNVLLWRREKRGWVRRLGLLTLLGFVTQAALGGLTVLLLLPTPISVSHAGLAVVVFGLLVSIALVTSPGWLGERPSTASEHAGTLRALAVSAAAAIYLQIVLGAAVRHTGAGLVIPDFPLVYGGLVPPAFSQLVAIHYAHRVWAIVVTAIVLALAVHALRRHRGDSVITRPALLLLAVLVVQIGLGSFTIWMRRAPVVTTAHVATGSAAFAISLVLALRSFRFVHARQRRPRAVAAAVMIPDAGAVREGGSIS